MNDFDLKKIRKKINISQEKLAKELGVTLKTVQNWESGGNIPNSKKDFIRNITQSLSAANVQPSAPICKEKDPENVMDGMLNLLKEQLKEKDAIIKDLNREIGAMTADNATLKKRINEVSKHRDRAMAILESSELPNHNKSQLLIHLEGAERLLTEHLHSNR